MYLWNAYAGYNYSKMGNNAISGTYGELGNTMVQSATGTGPSATIGFLPFVNFSVPSNSSSGYYMWVGTGTDEPQLSDYKIPNKCNYSTSDGFSVMNVTNGDISYDAEKNSFQKTRTTLLRNNSAEEITVTEIYLIKASTNFGNSYYVYYKELLTEPITVGSGKYLEISFTAKIENGEITGSVTTT